VLFGLIYDSKKDIARQEVSRTLDAPNSPLEPEMADRDNKHKENVQGAYYVDDQCIDCDLCRETAPANFTRENDGGYSYVVKQPESDEERAACDEAMAGCPVEAIGKDGAE
jgi:ferredoxin